MLLLASASPARSRLLRQASIPHRIQVSGVDEASIVEADPAQQVLRLAEAKALAVAAGLASPWSAPDGTPCQALLACDSLLSFEGEVFGKPRHTEEAEDRWRRMAGRWADLHTGHCLILGSAASRGQVPAPRLQTITTRLLFAALDGPAIGRYVATGEPLGCAGGFALEGRGGLLVERIEGCWSNVIGLSLPWLRREWPASL
jgi:septum formation protein